MPSRPRRPLVATDKRLRKTKSGGDHGTSERWQHSGRILQMTDRAGILAARVTEEHILDVLALKNILDQRMIAAALRLKADYHRAAIASRVTASYSGMSNMRDFFSAQRERSDSEEAAYKRWRRAIASLFPRQGAIVIATVCHDMPPASHEMAVLQVGLDRLATYYGMENVTQ